MPKAKRIFVIADFKEESPRSIRAQPRMWVKGLTRLGHDVQTFNYKSMMIRCNPFSSTHFAPAFVKRKTDKNLAEQVKSYQPDIVMLLSMKYLTADTVRAVRSILPDAVIVGRDDDPFPEENSDRLAIAKNTDLVINTSAGRFLKTYKDAGVPKCVFIPNLCDPDLQHQYDVEDKWKTDIIFTGKAEHTRLDRNNERFEIVQRLAEMPNARLYGCLNRPLVEGMELFYAISGARIGLSINIVNDEKLYHSDRLINYVSCGTFTLAKRVPDADLLFEDKVHLQYFDTADEFFELADWYLKHDKERERIALAGMQRAHNEFNCVKIAGYVFDLIEKGSYDVPWVTIM